jgi:hypothetical protein
MTMAAQSAASIKLPPTKDLPPPEAVNFFTFAWTSGVEMQLLAGYVDLLELKNQTDDASKIGEVTPVISHRLFMSMRGFALLRANVLDAAAKLVAAGIPLDELNPIVPLEDKK